MRFPKFLAGFLAIASWLAGCVEVGPTSSGPLSVVSTEVAASVFSRTCLLKESSGYGVQIETAQSAGLVYSVDTGPFPYAFQLPGNRLKVGNVEYNGMRVCTMYVDMTDDPSRLRQAILAAGRKVGGGEREQVFRSSSFQTAIRLPSGRLFLMNTFSREAGIEQSVISLTAVIDAAKIPGLIGK